MANSANQPISAKKGGMAVPCYVSPQKDTRVGFQLFSIMFYYLISATYQKIEDLFCPVHISGLSHSVDHTLLHPTEYGTYAIVLVVHTSKP